MWVSRQAAATHSSPYLSPTTVPQRYCLARWAYSLVSSFGSNGTCRPRTTSTTTAGHQTQLGFHTFGVEAGSRVDSRFNPPAALTATAILSAHERRAHHDPPG